jgi:hypothetical protein
MVEWMGNGLSFYCGFENVWWGFKNNLKRFVFLILTSDYSPSFFKNNI